MANDDGNGMRSRRALLGAGLGAVAATAVGAVSRPAAVRAADGQYVKVGGEYTGSSVTKITTTGTIALEGKSDSNSGVRGYSSSGSGVRGYSDLASGVYGESVSSYGVHGFSFSSFGVRGYSDLASGVRGQSISSYGVYGSSSSQAGVYGSSGSSSGVHGRSFSTDRPATVGRSEGNSTGLLGYSGSDSDDLPAARAKTGVLGIANQDAGAVGVTGTSSLGRGGLFAGKTAQISLFPSTAPTHPASGARGNLFVDSSGRLWFCKGGTTWTQLA